MDNNKSIQSGSQYRNIDKTIRNYSFYCLMDIKKIVNNWLLLKLAYNASFN